MGGGAGAPRPLVHLPLATARAAARGFDLLGRAAPLTSDQLQILAEGSATPANAIESGFGIRPLPFEAGLKSYLSPGRVERGPECCGPDACCAPAEIRKVTEAMRTEVLHVDQYREISFVSDSVTSTEEGGGFRVHGKLTLAAQTRDVAVDVRVEVGGDTLRAAGGFSVKQTDFGIKPYRGGPAGTVRVADRVTFDFDAVGVAQTAP